MKVYSYLRFSDPKQATGNSIERQIQYANRWAEERGHDLDQTLSLRDEGLSAYHQKHVKQGALGTFLRAIEEERIAPGSVLIVEGLDRLSRAEPIQAQAQLAQIINAGITVVTASDGKEYNRERLKAQPMDLVYSLLVMIRAHEESDTKSKRVTAALRRQCENWMTGAWRGVIRNGKDPAWVKWTGTSWELIPERVTAVRHVIDAYKKGHGGTEIVRQLTSLGLSPTGKLVAASNLYRTIRLRALIGEKEIEVQGTTYRLPGYYPSIISDAEFAELQQLASHRGRRKGKGEIPGIITGLRITYCGYCGSAVVGQNNMARRRNEDGSVQDGQRRILCVGVNHSKGCKGGSCSVVPVERALLTYCADQINMTAMLSGGGAEQAARDRVALARQRVAELQTQIERITDAILGAAQESTPLAFTRKALALEQELDAEMKRAMAAEQELTALQNRAAPALAEAWAALAGHAQAQDYDARMKIRRLVADTFSHIVVYTRSINLESDDSRRYIDLVLVAKSGTTRTLRIDRRSSAWVASEDFDSSALTSNEF